MTIEAQETRPVSTVPSHPPFFSPDIGEDYETFWSEMARTPEGARLAVGGHPFGRYPTEESLIWQGLPVARLVKECLDLQPSDRVLEVGCGIGRLARHIAPEVAGYHGADISAPMCLRAAWALRELPNVTVTHLKGCSLSPFPDRSFDAVYFQHVLIHLEQPDIERYLSEAYRVLRPGGRVYAQFYNRNHPQGFDELAHAVDQRVRDGRQQRGRVYCHTSADVRALLARAGFRVDGERSHLSPVRQTRAWWPDNDFFFWLIGTGRKG